MRSLAMIVHLGGNAEGPARAMAAAIEQVTGGQVDLEFSRPDPLDLPDITWMCGYLTVDFVSRLAAPMDVVAAPIFPGCDGPSYHSVIISGDPAVGTLRQARHATFAINEAESWSGHLAVLRHLGVDDLSERFGSVVESGSHERSIELVTEGLASVTAVDSTVWTASAEPPPQNVRILDRTTDWPSPPISINRRIEPATAHVIVSTLVAATVPGLDGVVPARIDSYLPMLRPT